MSFTWTRRVAATALASALVGLNVACTPTPPPPPGPPPEICHIDPSGHLADISWNGEWDHPIFVFFKDGNPPCYPAFQTSWVVNVPWNGSDVTYPAAQAYATVLCQGQEARYVYGASYVPKLPDSMWACPLF